MRKSAANPTRTTTLFKLRSRDSNFEKDFGLLAASGHETSKTEGNARQEHTSQTIASGPDKEEYKKPRASQPPPEDAKDQKTLALPIAAIQLEEESPCLMNDQDEKVLKASRFFTNANGKKDEVTPDSQSIQNPIIVQGDQDENQLPTAQEESRNKM